LLIGPLAVLLLATILLRLPPKFRFVRFLHSTILWISDRLIVFLYILGPLYVLLFTYVIFRNIT